MKRYRKEMMNPRFGLLDVRGKVIKLDFQKGEEKSTTFLIDSSELTLKYRNQSIVLRIAPDGQTIQEVEFFLDENQFSQKNIANFSDLLSVISRVDIQDYWKNEGVRFLLYSYIRFVVCILTAKNTMFYQNEETEMMLKYIAKQNKTVHLFNHLLESCLIQYSDYVVTNRAKYLLLLGLDPKEQYTATEIKKTGKEWMKLIHPDSEFGSHELFLKVNEAVNYLK